MNHAKSTGWVILGLAFCLLPYGWINVYNEPSSDDFKYAANYRELGAWQAGKNIYFGTCGRYATNIFLHWSPLSFGWIEGYRWTGLILLGALTASFYTLLWPLLGRIRPLGRHLLVWTIVALFLFKMPSINQGLYWFTGAYTYTTAILCVNLFLGLLISARGWSFENPAWESRSKSRETVLLLGGACLLGLAFGSTELAIFYGAIGLGMLNAWILFVRKKLDFPVLLVSVIGAGFGLLGILAPGNFLRSNTYGLAHDVDRLLRLTPLYQVWFLGSFLSLPLVLLAIVAGGKYNERTFPVSISLQGRWARWIPAVLFLLLMVLTFGFGIWATGNRPARRALNVLYHVQFLLVLFMLVQSFAADRRFWSRVRSWIRVPDSVLIGVALMLLAVTGNGGRAWKDLLVKGPEYRQQVEARYSLIQGARGGEVVVEPIRNKPLCLFFEDITEDPKAWQNIEMARYFEVQAIRLSKKDPYHPARE